jgi:cell division protein FtsB
MKLHKSQSGIAHLGLVVLLVVVLGGVGFAGYKVYKIRNDNKVVSEKRANNESTPAENQAKEDESADLKAKLDVKFLTTKVEEFAANNNGVYPSSLNVLEGLDPSIDLTKFTYTLSGREYTISTKLSDGSMFTYDSSSPAY